MRLKSGRSIKLKKSRIAAKDKRLLKTYQKLLSELPATGSATDNRARHLITLEIRKIQRRLDSEVSTSDLPRLERIAEEELARNKRLLTAPKRW